MGLLTREEHDQLIDLLLKLPNYLNPVVRNQLMYGLPQSLQGHISYDGAAKTHFTSMVDIADENSAELYDGVWPIIELMKRAIFQATVKSPIGNRLQGLLNEIERKAALRQVFSDALIGLPPQDASSLERLIDPYKGFLEPVDWRMAMHQAEMATCLITFQGYSPEGQGTGFLVRDNVLMTNFHVIESVFHGSVLPKDVRFYFDYKTFNGVLLGPCPEYTLAPDYLLDYSQENRLDYAMLLIDGTPGYDIVGDPATHLQRGWLLPKKHEFQSGEPLFIVQHPDSGTLRFAFDQVKTADDYRILYWTNTEQGSSGAPCFTLTWDLVALHQGTVHRRTDPERPNMGIPFSRILEQPRIQEILNI